MVFIVQFFSLYGVIYKLLIVEIITVKFITTLMYYAL